MHGRRPRSTLFPYTTLFRSVVLYDSAGTEEPRVIAPKSDIMYLQAALYEKPGAAPVILTVGRNVLSPNGWALAPIVSVSEGGTDRKSTRLNSSHSQLSYAVF